MTLSPYIQIWLKPSRQAANSEKLFDSSKPNTEFTTSIGQAYKIDFQFYKITQFFLGFIFIRMPRFHNKI